MKRSPVHTKQIIRKYIWTKRYAGIIGIVCKQNKIVKVNIQSEMGPSCENNIYNIYVCYKHWNLIMFCERRRNGVVSFPKNKQQSGF